MGYNTYVSGSFTIKPKLPEDELKKEGFDEDDGGQDLIIESAGTDDTVELVNGQITVIPGLSWSVATPRWEEPYKAYGLDECMGKLELLLQKHHATIEGSIYCDGEEGPDFHRYRGDGSKIVHEKPELVWPNGDVGWVA